MKIIFSSTIFLIISIFLPKQLIAGDSLTFTTHTTPPVSDFLGELLTESLRAESIKVIWNPLPGHRAIMKVNAGEIEGDASRVDSFLEITEFDAENYSKVEEFSVKISLASVSLKKNHVLNAGWNDLNTGFVAYIRGSMRIQRQIDSKFRSPTASLGQIFNMLEKGRVRSAVIFYSVALNQLNNMETYRRNLFQVSKIPGMEFYFYPYLNKSKLYYKPIIEKRLREAKLNGTYNRIARKYGITELE